MGETVRGPLGSVSSCMSLSKKVFLAIWIKHGLSCSSFGVLTSQEYHDEWRLSWRTIDLETQVGP
jgi:hypothetical protein